MQEILIESTTWDADLLSDLMLAAGALSVSAADPDEGTPEESAQFGEPGEAIATFGWKRNRLVVLVTDELEVAPWLENIWRDARELSPIDSKAPVWSVQPLIEHDWVRLTQAQFEPLLIGDRLWIKPSWHEVEVKPGQCLIEIDPGLAFGTGSHATTHLCLEWLVAQAAHGACGSLLDYGCGSGILAIAAAALGYAPVRGIDIDPQAVLAARNNAAHNQFDIRFEQADQTPTPWVNPNDFQAEAVRRADPSELALARDALVTASLVRYDVVVANILTKPLQVLAPLLCASLAPRGRLLLSGILERQAVEVTERYAPWLSLQRVGQCDGWVSLCGVMENSA